MAQLIREWIISCEQCIKKSRVDRNFHSLPLQNPYDQNTAPEDAMQIDSVPESPPSGS